MKNLAGLRRRGAGVREREEARAFVRTALAILATLPRRSRGTR